MHPCQTLLLLLFANVNTVLGVPIANIDCGDVCSASLGSSYTLSCTWSGILTTGITWKRDGTDVLNCNTAGACFPSITGCASGSYPKSTGATLTITSYNATTDAGNWDCRDGSDPSQSCTLPSVASGSIFGECTYTGSDYNISCYGITDHGNPPARIDLTEGSTILASSTSGGSVSSIQTDTAGKAYSCSVTGAAAVCLTPKSVDVTCPALSTTGIDVSGIDCGNVCTAKEGQPYSMSCVWTGRLDTGISFSKGGVDFLMCSTTGTCLPSTAGYASGNFPNSTGAIFSITSFNSTRDSGVWSCSDGSGQPQSCFLPKLAKGSLQGQCTKAGSVYNISCYGITDHGNPSARIDLTKGTTILASTTSGGSVSSIQTDTAGKTYSCSVTGAAAVCLTLKSVDVTCPDPPQSAPVISGLSSSPVYEGDSVSVSCRVTGGKPLVTTVTLTCPGGHQSSSTTTEGSDTRLTTLTFSVTRDLRSQPCRCSAVHSTGRYQLSANKTKNNVYYPPSEPSMSISPPLPWFEGQSTSAVCQSVDTGYPPASYLWYKDDVLVHQSSQLDLVNVTFQDNSKTFSCMASNKFTEVKGVTLQSNQIILDVQFPPVLMIHPNSPVRIPAGSDLVLNCSALSNPVNSTVSWYLGDTLLSMNGVLRLLSTSTKDSGTYRCEATVMSDMFGNLSSVLTIVLNVYDRPIEPKHFYCIVETEASITLHWEDQNLLKENVSFLLEQRSDDSKEYSLVNAVIQKSLSSSVYTASVTRLKGSRLFYFRIRTLDLGQQSDTVITTCFTSAGENGSNFAACVGTGIGSTVGVVLLVLVIVYLRRRHTVKRNETGRTDKSHIYQNASFSTESHEEGVAIGDVQEKNEYAELEAREPQQPNTYEKITTYENAANM